MICIKSVFIVSSIVLSFITTKYMVRIRGVGAMGQTGFLLWQDYILNFLGCALGWVAVYYFIFYRLGEKPEIVDLVIILFAYVGITGYLPHLVINKGLRPS